MTAAVIAGLVSLVGAGVSYAGQVSAAKTQSTFATLNASAQLAQATMSSKLAVAQSSLQAQQQQNAKAAGLVNANALRGEAEDKTRAAQINIARQMEDQERFRSMLRARSGKSGTVAGSGSQFDMLLSAAELQALENSESLYQTEIQRRQLFRAAEGERLGAEYSSIQAGIELMEGQSRASGYRAAGVQAQLQGMAGVSAARGASMAALGGAFSSVGGIASGAYRDFRLVLNQND